MYIRIAVFYQVCLSQIVSPRLSVNASFLTETKLCKLMFYLCRQLLLALGIAYVIFHSIQLLKLFQKIMCFLRTHNLYCVDYFTFYKFCLLNFHYTMVCGSFKDSKRLSFEHAVNGNISLERDWNCHGFKELNEQLFGDKYLLITFPEIFTLDMPNM